MLSTSMGLLSMLCRTQSVSHSLLRPPYVEFGRSNSKLIPFSIGRFFDILFSRQKDNANATFIGVDTGRSELIEALVDATLNKHERLDYAVNNAAVGNTSAQIPEINEEEWDRVLDINQTGVWAGMKYELPH